MKKRKLVLMKLASLRKYLVFGAAGGLLLVMGMLLSTGSLTMANHNVNPAVANADGGGFGKKVAGTYVVTRDPADGPSRILTIHEDGTLSSIQSIQFSGFSNQDGAWEKVGKHKAQASVLNTTYDVSTGAFTGVAISRWDLEFDEDFQTVEGEVSGARFEPGVDVLNPGNAVPILTFTDEFEAKRVMIK